MTLKKNIFKNGIATSFQKLVRVFEQLFLVPFFISAWGAAYYGEWLTLTIIPTMLAFSDFGFGSAAANSFVLKYTSGDRKSAANIYKSGFLIISSTILLGSLFSLGIMYILDNFNVFDKSLIDKNSAITAVFILIFVQLIRFYIQLYNAFFIAARKASISINLLTLSSFLKIIGGAFILLKGYGIVEFALSQLIVVISFLIIYIFKAISVLKLDKEYKGQVEKKYVKSILQKGLGYLMSPMWQAIYFQGTTFVVRIVLGAEAVAVFNTVRTLSRSVNQLFDMVNSSVFPELQYEIGVGNKEKAHKLFRVSVLTVFVIALIGAVFLFLFGLWFYNFWTNNELVVPKTMWYLFVVGILFNALWWNAAMVFRATNKPYFLAIVGVASASVSVLCSYYLAKPYGLNGVAFGSLILDVLMAIVILPYSCKLIGMNINDFFTKGIVDFSSLLNQLKSKLKSKLK
jgi:O-antigen/teichoic acid export membrane protein